MIDIEKIKQLLPHRYPFILVDRVNNWTYRESISAYKNVTVNEPFFNGHFPQQAIMPGVLQVEALAQSAGLIILLSQQQDNQANGKDEQSIFYFAGIDQARFKQIVIPGDTLNMQVTVTKARDKLWKFHGTAHVGEKLACEAEFMLIKDTE